ncbi:MAG: GH25 family lysozyme [Ferruginibacter sp.]
MAKRKKSIFKSILIPVILLAAIACAVYYINDYLSRPKFVRYPAFGIDLPVNYAIHGIDVSRYQHNIDWNAVQAMQDKQVKIGFAFIKATEGLGRVDNGFRQNWFNARQVLMPRGAYHFFISSKSGKAQAENFIETVNLLKGDLPPVLDIESTNGASVEDIQQRAKDWLLMIEKHYKIKPIIYTNVDFYENFLDGKFDDYPLWVAHYYVKDRPRITRKWTIWQHNEKGRVNGIDAFVDFNVFNGDSASFRKMLIK